MRNFLLIIQHWSIPSFLTPEFSSGFYIGKVEESGNSYPITISSSVSSNVCECKATTFFDGPLPLPPPLGGDIL